MYAIIKTGGKQLKVEVGQEIWVEKLEVEAGDTFTFEEVLMVGGKKQLLERHLLLKHQLQLKLLKMDAVRN